MSLPPFYPNPDDTHCQQCCLRMGYEYFYPEKQWTWDELDTLSGKIPGKYAWYMRLYIATAARGYDVVVYDIVDYPEFIKDAETYLKANYGADRAADILKNSVMDVVVEDARELLQTNGITIHQKSYTFDDLKGLLDKGHVLLTMVDEAVLAGIEGRAISHSILIHGYDDDGFIAHNPGVKSLDSAAASQHIAYDLFRRTCTLNDRGDTGKLMAFKPKE
ncbi:MAG: peptidase C39 family protein [Rhodospirillales bacterium]|nr:peptidase C39 family protein [Rhodospirillales bacterium]